MNRNKKQKTLQETLSALDGVLVALNSYPNLEDALLEKAQGELNKHLGQFFPTQLDFAKEILELLGGPDVMINILSEFLTYQLPFVEGAIKEVLLLNMFNLGGNCDIKPFIYEKAIKEGIIFDLKQIDLYDKLMVNPLDEKLGKYFYFGIEGCESAYDILQTAITPESKVPKLKKGQATLDKHGKVIYIERKRDFDCLLWYMKNKAAYREVWGKTTTEKEDRFIKAHDSQDWVNKFGSKNKVYYEIKVEDNTPKIKFYVHKEAKVRLPGREGSFERVNSTRKYTYQDGLVPKSLSYTYDSITKLNRKKIYINNLASSDFEYYIFDDKRNKWIKKVTYGSKKYNAMEELPIDIEIGTIVEVKGSFFLITGKPTISVNKLGKKYVSNVKHSECIDITTDISANTTIFVDMDLDGNKEKTKNGQIMTSSFSEYLPNNVGRLKWKKTTELELDKKHKIALNTCYYDNADNTDEFVLGKSNILLPPYVEDKDGKYIKCYNVSEVNSENKYSKDFGILTLDFSPRTGNVLQSDGRPMQQQTPYDNVLHVFFGNVKEFPSPERDELNENLKKVSLDNRYASKILRKVKKCINKHKKLWDSKRSEWKKNGKISEPTTQQEDLDYYVAYKSYLMLLNGHNDEIKNTLTAESELYDNINEIILKLYEIGTIIDKWYDESQFEKTLGVFNFIEFSAMLEKVIAKLNGYSISAYTKRVGQIMASFEDTLYLSAKNLKYPEAIKNYYYKHTLYEFNIDYMSSVQLFDPKVLAAQMITSLFGGATIEATIGSTFSWKTEYIRDITQKTVEKIIASEDVTISDCFFTFSNDAINAMQRASDLRQAGVHSSHGEVNGTKTIDPLKLIEGLNEIDSSADQAGKMEIIKGVIEKASFEVSSESVKEDEYLAINASYGVRMSFIEKMMTNLCTQLVMSVLSPKVYLMILINLHMFGLSTNFDIKSFIESFLGLIRNIINEVVNEFMKFMVSKIMEIVEDLMRKLIKTLALEQVEMYMRILKQILGHLRLLINGRDGIGWIQDKNVGADIRHVDIQEPANEC